MAKVLVAVDRHGGVVAAESSLEAAESGLVEHKLPVGA